MFEGVILILIIASSVVLAWDNPLIDPEGKLHKNLLNINMVFTVLFTIEITIRIIAQGFWSNHFFHVPPYLSSIWNCLDLLIVVTSIIDMVATLMNVGSNNMGAVKAMRSLRALRPLRVIKSSPKLKQVVNAFFGSLTAIKNILFIGFLILIIFSVIGISLFKGKFFACDIDGDNIITK